MRVQTLSRTQILQDFRLRCQALAADDNRGFKQEFEELEEVGKELPARAGDSGVNRQKNRYPYILPYDHCRVRLSVQGAQPHTDYINANFVPGGGSERDFICTQGPLLNTTADFWRMVWEQNVRIIVMVTALRHKDQVLCDRYWPLERETAHHGSIQVTTVTQQHGPDCFISSINIRQRACPADRTVTHFYFPSWPDRGVPKDATSLVTFTELVRQQVEAGPRLGPAVVHCSAGVGRSGTFVAALWLMQLCARGIPPDIRAAVEDLRLHRMWMVQTLEQYVLVHQCLLQWLSGVGSSRTPAQGAEVNRRVQDQAGGSSGRRRRRPQQQQQQQHRQAAPAARQQLSGPGTLLRRLLLLPASRSNQDSHGP
ncbi:receptor-type tyrosine-protein phosphatase V-like [Clinocottus analis]|uniref:receptor-type tyrosine-protein phosphatase V-like n=1 Tax=Clinocottus analis TaxID=304258 RepID=UPI0035C1421A